LNLRPVHGGGKRILLAHYKNIPPLIGCLVSSRLATLNELNTVYGVEAAYDLLEILIVDNHNKALIENAK
jgi:hypothetical protein